MPQKRKRAATNAADGRHGQDNEDASSRNQRPRRSYGDDRFRRGRLVPISVPEYRMTRILTSANVTSVLALNLE